MARPRKNPTPPAQSGQQVPQDRPTQDAQQGAETVAGQAPPVLEGQQHAEPQPQPQPQSQSQPQSQALPPQAMPATAVEPLDEYLRRVERVHIERDVVATAATHPHASERVWPGTYGGIRLSAGPVSVTYSDGTTE